MEQRTIEYSKLVDIFKLHNVGLGGSSDDDYGSLEKGKENMAKLLCSAFYYGDLDICSALIDAGADINYQLPFWVDRATNNLLYMPILHRLIYFEKLKAFEASILIEKVNKIAKGESADYNRMLAEGIIPSERYHISLDLVKFMIEHGLNLEAKDSFGNTILYKAAKIGRMDLVKYFVSQGCKVYIEYLIGVQKYEVMEFLWNKLLDDGVDVRAECFESKYTERKLTILEKAIEECIYPNLVEFLLHKGFEIKPEYLVLAGTSGMMKFLLEEGISTKEYGQEALYSAVIKNQFENVNLLLQYGISPNFYQIFDYKPRHFTWEFREIYAKQELQLTPLQVALFEGNDRIARLLLENNADVNAKIKGKLRQPEKYKDEMSILQIAQLFEDKKILKLLNEYINHKN